MEVILHDAKCDNTDVILYRQGTKDGEEDYAVFVGVEDESAVYGDLKDVLITFPVEFSFGCHSIKF